MPSSIEECSNGSREIKPNSAFANNEHEVGNLLQAGVNVNGKNALGETPLHLAACIGNLLYISKLLSMGADVGSTTLAGETALHNAAQCGQAEALLLLLDGGADIQAIDLKGRTVLQTAIEEGGDNYEIVSLLIERGADELARYTHRSKQHNIVTLLKLKRPLLSPLTK